MNNQTNIALLSALLIFSATSCTLPTAKTGQISGVVTQSSTDKPVEGVSVKYGNSEQFTDELGRYSIESIPDGLQGLTFSKMGFATLVSQVEIPSDGAVEHNVSISVMTHGWAVGKVETEYASIFHSDNGGISWVRQGSYSTVPPEDLLCVCAVNEKTCWVAGKPTLNVVRNRMEFSILKTSDSGESWRRQGQTIGTQDPCSVTGICATDTSNVFAVTDANLILTGAKGGLTWNVCKTSDHISAFHAISTSDGIHLWAGGQTVEGGTNGLEYSSDGGKEWSFLPIEGISDSDSIMDISAVDSNHVYISGTFGIMHTSDHGLTWKKISETGDSPAQTITTLGSLNFWTYLADGSLKFTHDAFASVNTASVPVVNDMTVTSISLLGDAENGALSFISEDRTVPGGILFTNDGGATWEEATIPFKVAVNELSFAGTRH